MKNLVKLRGYEFEEKVPWYDIFDLEKVDGRSR